MKRICAPPDPKIGRLGSTRGSSAPCLPPDDPTGGLGGFEGPPVPYPIRFPHSLLTDPIRKCGGRLPYMHPPTPKIGHLGSTRGSSAPCLPPADPTGGLGGVEGPPVPYPIRFPSSVLTDPIRKWGWAAPISPLPPQYGIFGGGQPQKGGVLPPVCPPMTLQGVWGGFEGPPVPYPIRFPSSVLIDPIRKWGWGCPYIPPPI